MTPLATSSRRRPSIEVTAHDPDIGARLRESFAPGLDVHIVHLPGQPWGKVAQAAVRIRRAGFNPVPHLAARSIGGRADLQEYLQSLQSGAGVETLMLVGGDVDKPAGPYRASIDVLNTGLIPRHGIREVVFAGYPEGHPSVPASVLSEALAAKLLQAGAQGLSSKIITQFCFEPQPILDYAAAAAAPIRIGVAGPATLAGLTRFALRCGVGRSLGALRRHAQDVGKLISESSQDDVIEAILPAPPPQFDGFHVFVFGGLRRTADWFQRLGWVSLESASPPIS